MPPGTLQMTHFVMILRSIKETIKEFYQRYCERLEEHPNNLAPNLMKARGIVKKLKRKRSTNLLN